MIDNELIFNKLPILSEDNKQCDKSDSIKKVEHWLLTHSAGYFAHAISDANVDRVLQCGELKPGEMILREKKIVEYEKGSTINSRSTDQPIYLSAEELKNLLDSCLSDQQKERLNELGKIVDPIAAKEKKHEFIRLRNKLEDFLEEKIPSNSAEKKKLVIRLEELQKDETLKNYVEYKELKNLEKARFVKLKNIHFFEQEYTLLNLLSAFTWQFSYIRRTEKFQKLIESLGKIHNCGIHQILIEIDQSLGNEKIDHYLSKKYSKGCPIDVLIKARDYLLRNEKLNCEIRMMKNKIAWNYGKVVVLTGFTSENAKQQVIRDEKAQCCGEIFTPQPWLNNGEFFTFDLKKNEDILILGPRVLLGKYQDQGYSNLVFSEDLTEEQKKFFNVPL